MNFFNVTKIKMDHLINKVRQHKNAHQAPAKLAVLGMAALMLSACAGTPAYAQSRDHVRVIVMGDDSGNAVSRDSNVHQRVLAELKESVFRLGFDVVDEEMIGSELGFNFTTKRSKSELISTVKLANQSMQANLHSRALMLFRIHATSKNLGYAVRLGIRVEGELYDIDNNQFLGAFELPRITASAPANCDESEACTIERVGDHARDIAAGLGDVLAKKLAYLTSSNGSNQAVSSTPSDMRCNNLSNTYTLEFKRIDASDISMMMNTITNANAGIDPNDRFPCYVNHDILGGGNSTIRRYSYVSTASKVKIYDWLSLILTDLGMQPDQDVLILNNGSKFLIENIIQGSNQPKLDTSGSRFQ